MSGLAAGLALGLILAWGLVRSRGTPAVILSDPSGAEVRIGERVLGRTPLVLDRIPLGAGREVTLRLTDHRERSVVLDESGPVLVAQARLESALGPVRIESEPSGAAVILDGEAVGATPLDVPAVRLDVPHRFDLELRGHEADSFIVRPEEAGRVFKRRLVRSTGH
jgi:hypothetical protein